MNLFKTYTGSAFLNQALLTLQELTGKNELSELDTDDMLAAFMQPYRNIPLSLTNINRRLKSYTMIFTTNGPLLNPTIPKDKRELIYKETIRSILIAPENDGDCICELTGLRYSKPFSLYYHSALANVGFTKKEIDKKDITINRCWFPLIGGLGSDAQALPQASSAVNVHPVCVVAMQFLALSALLYQRNRNDKPGVFIVDSPVISFTASMVSYFVQRVKEGTTLRSNTDKIDNIKDYCKGDYIFKALEKLAEQESSYESFCGFNFWSFSNFGNGAFCSIDRIPNQLVRKLRHLYANPYCKPQLATFLHDTYWSESLITALDGNLDFRGLYPATLKIKKGKKTTTIEHRGAEIPFFEHYHRIIGNDSKIVCAKYIAYLLRNQTLNEKEHKFLQRKDAYLGKNTATYTALIAKLLREAVEQQQWHPSQHLEILDDNTAIPIRSGFRNILPMVHYYFQKLEEGEIVDKPAIPEEPQVASYHAIKLFLFLLNLDKDKRTMKQLMQRDFQQVSLNELLWRVGSQHYSLEHIYPLLYDKENRPIKFGLRELLRIFLVHNNGDLTRYAKQIEAPYVRLEQKQKEYLARLQAFCNFYFGYWQTFRNNNSNDLSAFRIHVLRPMLGHRFRLGAWVEDVVERMKAAYSEDTMKLFELRDENIFSEKLLYDFTGVYNPQFARFAIIYNFRNYSAFRVSA